MRFRLGLPAGENHPAWVLATFLVLIALFLDGLLDLLALLLHVLFAWWLRSRFGLPSGRIWLRRHRRLTMEWRALDGRAEAGLAAAGRG